MPKQPPRLLRLRHTFVVLILTLFAAGCVTTNAPRPVPSYCAVARPLTWDERDTEQTQREIFSHNLTWEQFCK